MKTWLLAAVAAVWLTMPACTRHTVRIEEVPVHVTLDPVYIKVDVTVTVKDDLNNIFNKIEGTGKTGTEPKAPEKK